MTKILSNKSNIDLDYPICRPSLDLDFTQEILDPRITFSRGSIGTRVNRNRLIETVSANQPRFDYDPVTGECKGLLIEESRSNLVDYSEDFSNVIWNKTSSSIQTNVITAPDGNTTADKLIINGGINGGYVIRDVSITSGTTYTASCFVKAAEFSSFTLLFQSNAFGSNINARFNLSTGTLGVIDAGATASIQAFPNGWYRCIATATATATISSGVQFRVSLRGDGTSGICIWGAQLEAGAFPTSYIPTTASTVTRSADNASMTGTNFSSWYNQTEGTVFCVYKNNTTDFTTRKNVYSITSPNYAIELRSPNAGSSSLRFSYNGQFNSIPNQISASLNQRKTAFSFNQNKHYAYIDSVYVVPSNLNQLNDNTKNSLLIGNRLISATDYLNGTISRLTYYPRALKPNQLQFLTA